MYIKDVSIQNFRAIENRTINIKNDDGILVITGDNGTGKSTVVNAIIWCFTGKVPGFNTEDFRETDAIVRFGADGVTVTVTIVDDGEEIVLSRWRDASERTNTSTKMSITRGGRKTDKKKEVDRILESVIGDVNDFIITTFLNREMLRPLLKGSSDSADIIDIFLDVDMFDAIKDGMPTREINRALKNTLSRLSKIDMSEVGMIEQQMSEIEKRYQKFVKEGIEPSYDGVNKSMKEVYNKIIEMNARIGGEITEVPKIVNIDSLRLALSKTISQLSSTKSDKVLSSVNTAIKMLKKINKLESDLSNIDEVSNNGFVSIEQKINNIYNTVIDVKSTQESLHMLKSMTRDLKKIGSLLKRKFEIKETNREFVKAVKEFIPLIREEVMRIDGIKKMGDIEITCPECSERFKISNVPDIAVDVTHIDDILFNVNSALSDIKNDYIDTDIEKLNNEREKLEKEMTKEKERYKEYIRKVAKIKNDIEISKNALNMELERIGIPINSDNILELLEQYKPEKGTIDVESEIKEYERIKGTVDMIGSAMSFMSEKSSIEEKYREILPIRTTYNELNIQKEKIEKFKKKIGTILDIMTHVKEYVAHEILEKLQEDINKIFEQMFHDSTFTGVRIEPVARKVGKSHSVKYRFVMETEKSDNAFAMTHLSSAQEAITALSAFLAFSMTSYSNRELGITILDDPSASMDDIYKSSLAEIIKLFAEEIKEHDGMLIITTADDELVDMLTKNNNAIINMGEIKSMSNISSIRGWLSKKLKEIA